MYQVEALVLWNRFVLILKPLSILIPSPNTCIAFFSIFWQLFRNANRRYNPYVHCKHGSTKYKNINIHSYSHIDELHKSNMKIKWKKQENKLCDNLSLFL